MFQPIFLRAAKIRREFAVQASFDDPEKGLGGSSHDFAGYFLAKTSPL
jgi:hypothetical protein